MSTSKIEKRKYFKEDTDFVIVRHEFLERGFSLHEAVIIEFMYQNKNSSYYFKYPISAIEKATKLSKNVIYETLKKLKGASLLEQDHLWYGFTINFRDLHEEVCENVDNGRNTYSKIIFTLREKYKLTYLEYCILDTFRVLTSKGYLKYSPKFFANKFHRTIRTYYDVRMNLEEKNLIEIKSLNFLTLDPKIRQEMNSFFLKR